MCESFVFLCSQTLWTAVGSLSALGALVYAGRLFSATDDTLKEMLDQSITLRKQLELQREEFEASKERHIEDKKEKKKAEFLREDVSGQRYRAVYTKNDHNVPGRLRMDKHPSGKRSFTFDPDSKDNGIPTSHLFMSDYLKKIDMIKIIDDLFSTEL